jgi:hypothetical protein
VQCECGIHTPAFSGDLLDNSECKGYVPAVSSAVPAVSSADEDDECDGPFVATGSIGTYFLGGRGTGSLYRAHEHVYSACTLTIDGVDDNFDDTTGNNIYLQEVSEIELFDRGLMVKSKRVGSRRR